MEIASSPSRKGNSTNLLSSVYPYVTNELVFLTELFAAPGIKMYVDSKILTTGFLRKPITWVFFLKNELKSLSI